MEGIRETRRGEVSGERKMWKGELGKVRRGDLWKINRGEPGVMRRGEVEKVTV